MASHNRFTHGPGAARTTEATDTSRVKANCLRNPRQFALQIQGHLEGHAARANLCGNSIIDQHDRKAHTAVAPGDVPQWSPSFAPIASRWGRIDPKVGCREFQLTSRWPASAPRSLVSCGEIPITLAKATDIGNPEPRSRSWVTRCRYAQPLPCR